MNTEIPQQARMTPEQAFARLQEWFQKQTQLAKLKVHEHLERVELSAFYFTDPREGVNRLDLGGGFDLKLDHSFNITVNEDDLSGAKASDIKRLKLPWDDLFVYKPSLSKAIYNSLTPEQKLYVDQFLEIKPASPKLAIVPSANREGQAAHAAAAAPAPKLDPARISITADPSNATDGDYFQGDDGAWWQLRVEENGWVAVPPDLCGELSAIKLALSTIKSTEMGSAAPPPPSDAGFAIALAAEDAQPGECFFDGDTWWRLDDASEWIEMEPDLATQAQLAAALADATAAAAAAKPKRGRKRKS